MKQANSNNFNKPEESKTISVGEMSVVALLKQLSTNKESLNYNFRKVFIPKFDNLNSCIIKNITPTIQNIDDTLTLMYQLSLLGYLKNTKKINNSTNIQATNSLKIFSSIDNTLKEIKNLLNKNTFGNQPDKKSFKDKSADFANKLLFKNQISDNLITILETTNILISNVISNQELTIAYLKKIVNNIKNQEKQKPNKKGKTIIINNDIASTLNALKEFQNEFDSKFVDLFERFVKVYKDFTDAGLTKRFVVIISNLEAFQIALRIVGIQISRTKNLFNGLLKSITLLAIAFLLPPFQLGFVFLITMIKTLQLTVGGPKGLFLIRNIRGLGSSILMVVAGSLLMSKVPVENIVKLIFALTAVAGVLKLFEKKNKGESIVPSKSSINKKSSFKVSGIFSAAMGIILLLWAISFVRQIDWAGAGALLTFIAGLSLILYLFNRRKYGKKGPMDSLLSISIGITVLLLCAEAASEVNWKGAMVICAFIFAIGLTLAITNKLGGRSKMNGLLGFSFGLTILLLCVDAATEVDWEKGWTIILFIGAINLAISLSNKIGGKGGKTGMLGFAFGVALLLLTINAAAEVDFGPGWKLVAIIGAIIGLLYLNRLGNGEKIKVSGGTGKLMLQILTITAAIVLWSSALYILSKVDIRLEQVILFATTIGIIVSTFYLVSKLSARISVASVVMVEMIPCILLMVGATLIISLIKPNIESVMLFAITSSIIISVMYLIGLLDKQISKGAAIAIVVASAGILLSVATSIISLVNPNWESFGFFAAVAGSLVVLMTLFGIFSVPMAIGAGIMIVVAASLIIFSLGLHILSAIDVNWEAFGLFCATTGSLILLLTLYAVASPILLIGSVAIIGVGLSLLVVASSFYIISNLNIQEEQIKAFVNSIRLIATEMCMLLPFIIAAVPSSALLIIVSVATILTASSLYIVSELKINVENIKLFGKAIVKLTEAYDECGLWAITKAVAKSALLIPISITTLITALALRAISTLDINETKIDKFGIIIGKFITIMCDIVSQHAKEIENNKKAFKILADMANAAGSIVNVIESMANMTVGVWGIDKQTGELKMIDKRQINDNDFDLITRNMGKMLQALIQPLSIISSDDDIWDFGTIKVKNPFGKSGFFSSGDMSGINRIKAIGDAFEKIPAIMQAFCDNPLLTDVTDEGSIKMQRLQENIGTFFDTIIMCMNKLPQKSVLSNWFDGTASWLEDTVQPVFNSSTIVLDGLQKSLFWKSPNLNVLWPRVISFFDTTKYVAQTVNDSKKYKMPKSFAKEVIDFYNELNKLSTNQWLSSANIETTSTIALNTKSLVDTLGDSGKFNQLNKNLQNTDKNIKSIVGNINKINVSKAAALERNLKLLTQAKSQEALREAIEQLKEMIGLLKDVQEKQVSATNYQTNQFAQRFDTDNTFKANLSKTNEEKNAEILVILQKLQALFEGTGIHVETNLAGVSDEIVQALHEAGLTDKVNSGWKGFSK